MPTNQADPIQRSLVSAAKQLGKAREAERAAWDKARAVANAAIAAGWAETTVAAVLQVDRMTVRKWIGKR